MFYFTGWIIIFKNIAMQALNITNHNHEHEQGFLFKPAY